MNRPQSRALASVSETIPANSSSASGTVMITDNEIPLADTPFKNDMNVSI